jgi:hypothetical protein
MLKCKWKELFSLNICITEFMHSTCFQVLFDRLLKVNYGWEKHKNSTVLN